MAFRSPNTMYPSSPALWHHGSFVAGRDTHRPKTFADSMQQGAMMLYLVRQNGFDRDSPSLI